MIRLICPFCHTALLPGEVEVAASPQGSFLICPECDHVIASEPARPDSPVTEDLPVHV